MKKEDLLSMLRSAGVDESGVSLAANAWELGAEDERNECVKFVESKIDDGFTEPQSAKDYWNSTCRNIAMSLRKR